MTDDPQVPVGDAHDDELLAALRAPGTPAELAEEQAYLAMFRAELGATVGPVATVTPLHHRRRLAGRVGAGGALAVALALTTGGVAAAAYTHHLPAPLQTAASHVLPKVDPAPHQDPVVAPRPTTAPNSTTTPSPGSATPSQQPTSGPGSPATSSGAPHPTRGPSTGPSGHPSGSASPSHAPTHPAHPTHAVSPTNSPTPSPSPTTSPSPTVSASPTTPVAPTVSPTVSPTVTGTPTTPVDTSPASVSISGTATEVGYGSTVGFTGVVTTADGAPVARQRVALQARSGSGWATVATTQTDATGYVGLSSPPVDATTVFRWKTHGVRSATWHVTEQPLIFASYSTGADGQVVITLTTQGGRTGDSVDLVTRQDGTVAAGSLDADGSVTFALTQAKKHQKYAIHLARTSLHAAASTTIDVTRSGRADPSASPSPSPSA